MAAVTRQPFAPLDGARLQNLTSIKNRQNAIAPPVAGKRKASEIVEDDFENVDPQLFSKRSKGSDTFFPTKDCLKPSSYVLKPATKPVESSICSAARPLATPRSRTLLHAKSPIAKLNTSVTRTTPLSAPAGRSPTRGKKSGILSSRRRTLGPYSRVDPPQFNLSAAAPFSLDAALKGTIPSYAARSSASSEATPAAPAPAKKNDDLSALIEPEMKASWFFDIHEDTPEQEMTNLLQHGTCTLDISSDEESEQKASRERAEGRDKENIPPADDVSQTARRAARRPVAEDDMVVEKERIALGEMNATDYYAAGCDETSVVFIPADEVEEAQVVEEATPVPAPAPASALPSSDFAPEINLEPLHDIKDVDELMAKDEPSSKAAVLEPMEGTGETFELWESGSAKDETEGGIAVAVAAS